MDKYFLISEYKCENNPIYTDVVTEIQVFETKLQCEEEINKKKEEGHIIIMVINGRSLPVVSKKQIITSYKIDDTIYP